MSALQLAVRSHLSWLSFSDVSLMASRRRYVLAQSLSLRHTEPRGPTLLVFRRKKWHRLLVPLARILLDLIGDLPTFGTSGADPQQHSGEQVAQVHDHAVLCCNLPTE